MQKQRQKQRAHWSSRWTFILAASGSAVGLGNIWKFPYITGENGGGIFVLIYLACILFVAVPVLMAELVLGRSQQKDPITAFKTLAVKQGYHRSWQTIGWMGLAGSFLLLSFYSVIAGWSIAYIFKVISGVFVNTTPEQTGQYFADFIADPLRLLFWHSLFMVLILGVVARGVENGLEKINQWLMPGLIIILLVLLVYGMVQGNFLQALDFMFNFRLDKLSGEAVIKALGHAFFSLSVGMAVIMVYGSYLPKHISIPQTTFAIAFIDTAIALIAGLAVFSIVFANNLDAASGPGLVFVTLPIAFSQMPVGGLIGFLFFTLLCFAALTSAISLMEPLISWMVERHGFTRLRASVSVGFIAWFIGIGTVLSFNLWEEARLLGKWNFFEFLDFLTSNLLLPLGGLLIAVFVGWVMCKNQFKEALAWRGQGFNFWYLCLKLICPLGILSFFLYALYQVF